MSKYKLVISSSSELFKLYSIIIDTSEKTVTCDCKSGRIRGYCKHIKFYKKLIKDLLHETPGVNVEK